MKHKWLSSLLVGVLAFFPVLVEGQTFLLKWGSAGSGSGQFSAPTDVYVADQNNALMQTEGNQSQAAELLGVHRTYLARMMKTLKLR
jgi:transcriptional regulator of acetoin/glycerol metabolism